MWWVPTVIEHTARGEREWTVFSRLLKDRIIFLGWEIDDNLASVVIAQLLYLESEDPDKDIYLYINSPGGNVNSTLAVYDTMQYVRCPISTICIGQASSMSALLLAAGTPGKRRALPHSRILLHQPLGSFSGQATDVDIRTREILFLKNQVVKLLSNHSGRSVEQILKDSDRERFLSPEEAREYGLIDEVIDQNSVPGGVSGTKHP
ncbi:MAG TPA: ATP-dependent Clp protease proteolytic subunit [Myxococcota bacterium]|nr:ATP-dependent Clp protease proteolytic subunit [Myxococcota bacterium]HOA13524.1 ATP-dependent Clp protease proteolytic subunit [Myxococcota bacterium]HOC98661.1 ATP-dependent Clp protease proteolytic subunit [Myxococcota bacterium]HOH77013.1 ATP-dependent Clp protease proteolytic subunit [Myxococcota bacterium]HPV04256.1 ATP-dependent Clp protease proteolytic subunit [Myxococcota bacterium]